MDNTNSSDPLFIIENSGNTCYIDSLLMALFYHPSHIDGILRKIPKNTDNIYLQEYIYECFVQQVRKNNSILMDTIDTLRYICIRCGWICFEEVYEQQDVNEFYTFLMETFDTVPIQFKKETFTDISNESGEIEELYFIPLSLPYNKELGTCIEEEVKVKDLLYNWLYSNDVDVNRSVTYKGEKIKENVKGLNVYHLQNIPDFVALSINRFPTVNKRLDINVNIQKKICPFRNSNDMNLKDIEWSFHSAICHRGDDLQSGHYYSLLYNKDTDIWYIFDDQCQPSIYEVKMDDKSVTTDIRKNCVFLIYKLGF